MARQTTHLFANHFHRTELEDGVDIGFMRSNCTVCLTVC